MYYNISPRYYLGLLNQDSGNEIDFEQISSYKVLDNYAYQKEPLVVQEEEQHEIVQMLTQPAGKNVIKKQVCSCQSTIENQNRPALMQYRNKNFPTLSLKQLIALFKLLPLWEQNRYPGIQELLQEKARMLKEKKQVTFARRHHIKLNRCLESAIFYRRFLTYDLIPAFQRSKRMRDPSIYIPCIAKFLELSEKIQNQ